MNTGQGLGFAVICDSHNYKSCGSPQYKIWPLPTNFVTKPGGESSREFIESAARTLEMTVDELGQRIGYPSLKRAMQGEINFPDARRLHIMDLLRLNEAYGPNVVRYPQRLEESEDLESTRVADGEDEYLGGRVNEEPPATPRRGDSLVSAHTDAEIEERIIELVRFLRDSRTRNRGDFAHQIKQLVDRLASSPSQHQFQKQ